MPVRMILISTFIAELLCFGKSNTCCGFLGYFSEAFHSEEMPFKAHKMAPTFVNATHLNSAEIISWYRPIPIKLFKFKDVPPHLRQIGLCKP